MTVSNARTIRTEWLVIDIPKLSHIYVIPRVTENNYFSVTCFDKAWNYVCQFSDLINDVRYIDNKKDEMNNDNGL